MRGLDTITIKGLRAKGYHGVLAQERRDGQEFAVDLTVWLDLRPSGTSDQLDDTVNYDTLATEVIDLVTGPPVNLVETLAARIADRVLQHRSIAEVEVTIHKPHAPISVAFDDVAVTIRRLAQ